MQRINNVLRVHFADRMSVCIVPLSILAAAFIVIIGIGVAAGFMGISEQSRLDMYEGMQYNGVIWSVLGMGMGIGFATMGQHLAFALGMGVTRREWVLGSSLVFLIVAFAITVIVTIGKVLERATEGWGLHVRMFDTVHTSTGHWWQTSVQTFLIVVAGMSIASMFGAIWNRWGKTGLSVVGAGFLLIGVIVFALVIMLPAEQVMRALEALNQPWGVWMLVLAAVAALAGGTWALFTRRAEVR